MIEPSIEACILEYAIQQFLRRLALSVQTLEFVRLAVCNVGHFVNSQPWRFVTPSFCVGLWFERLVARCARDPGEGEDFLDVCLFSISKVHVVCGMVGADNLEVDIHFRTNHKTRQAKDHVHSQRVKIPRVRPVAS